jgi:hypothetical protein
LPLFIAQAYVIKNLIDAAAFATRLLERGATEEMSKNARTLIVAAEQVCVCVWFAASQSHDFSLTQCGYYAVDVFLFI